MLERLRKTRRFEIPLSWSKEIDRERSVYWQFALGSAFGTMLAYYWLLPAHWRPSASAVHAALGVVFLPALLLCVAWLLFRRRYMKQLDRCVEDEFPGISRDPSIRLTAVRFLARPCPPQTVLRYRLHYRALAVMLGLVFAYQAIVIGDPGNFSDNARPHTGQAANPAQPGGGR
jgi:hypothetical protein